MLFITLLVILVCIYLLIEMIAFEWLKTIKGEQNLTIAERHSLWKWWYLLKHLKGISNE